MYLSISMFWNFPVILYYGCSLTILEVPIIRPRPELLTPRTSLSLVGPLPVISLLTSLVGFTTSHSDDYDALLPSFSLELTCDAQPWLGVTRGGFEIPGICSHSQGWKPWHRLLIPSSFSWNSECWLKLLSIYYESGHFVLPSMQLKKYEKHMNIFCSATQHITYQGEWERTLRLYHWGCPAEMKPAHLPGNRSSETFHRNVTVSSYG